MIAVLLGVGIAEALVWAWALLGAIGNIHDHQAAEPLQMDEAARDRYLMDLDEAQHRRWQTMHPALPVSHRGVGHATGALAYVPRHGIACGPVTAEFQRIVAASLAGAR